MVKKKYNVYCRKPLFSTAEHVYEYCKKITGPQSVGWVIMISTPFYWLDDYDMYAILSDIYAIFSSGICDSLRWYLSQYIRWYLNQSIR